MWPVCSFSLTRWQERGVNRQLHHFRWSGSMESVHGEIHHSHTILNEDKQNRPTCKGPCLSMKTVAISKEGWMSNITWFMVLTMPLKKNSSFFTHELRVKSFDNHDSILWVLCIRYMYKQVHTCPYPTVVLDVQDSKLLIRGSRNMLFNCQISVNMSVTLLWLYF